MGAVSTGLVLDTSGSMGDKIGLLKDAAIRFVRAANPDDEYFLIKFQGGPKWACPSELTWLDCRSECRNASYGCCALVRPLLALGRGL
jgi:hypothetical protein